MWSGDSNMQKMLEAVACAFLTASADGFGRNEDTAVYVTHVVKQNSLR